MMEELLLTKEGYNSLEEELEELVTVRRKEISERLKEAISFGDISENSEYDAAKDEQAEAEERISELETMLRKAKIINEDEVNGDTVSIGLKVKVKDLNLNEEMEFSIVGVTESDPFNGKLSNESLVGQNLLDRRIGDVVEFKVPDGTVKYEILDIFK